MTHAMLSESLTRSPGTPPSHCRGDLDPVDGGKRSLSYAEADAAPFFDAALNGEGEFGATMRIDLYRCRYCKATIVAARKPDEQNRLVGFQRNEWRKPEPVPATA